MFITCGNYLIEKKKKSFHRIYPNMSSFKIFNKIRLFARVIIKSENSFTGRYLDSYFNCNNLEVDMTMSLSKTNLLP